MFCYEVHANESRKRGLDMNKHVCLRVYCTQGKSLHERTDIERFGSYLDREDDGSRSRTSRSFENSLPTQVMMILGWQASLVRYRISRSSLMMEDVSISVMPVTYTKCNLLMKKR